MRVGERCIFIPNPPPSGKKSGNAQFSKDVAAWTFQEKLVLRIDGVSHHKLGGSESPEIYTTNDQIVSISLLNRVPLLTGTAGIYRSHLQVRTCHIIVDSILRHLRPPT